jgi:tRNA(fMet)-specific endonuclease VapC
MSSEARYLLDTNILSALAKNPQGPVYSKIREHGEESVCTSIIVACEIQFGLEKSGSSILRDRMERILASIETIAYEQSVESHYAEIRWQLEKAGTPIGPNDLLIAAHARHLGLTLVTDNVAEFKRVPSLKIENWLF